MDGVTRAYEDDRGKLGGGDIDIIEIRGAKKKFFNICKNLSEDLDLVRELNFKIICAVEI